MNLELLNRGFIPEDEKVTEEVPGPVLVTE